jgi:hypothetical protein
MIITNKRLKRNLAYEKTHQGGLDLQTVKSNVGLDFEFSVPKGNFYYPVSINYEVIRLIKLELR